MDIFKLLNFKNEIIFGLLKENLENILNHEV
jgi:hypothetical protein